MGNIFYWENKSKMGGNVILPSDFYKPVVQPTVPIPLPVLPPVNLSNTPVKSKLPKIPANPNIFPQFRQNKNIPVTLLPIFCQKTPLKIEDMISPEAREETSTEQTEKILAQVKMIIGNFAERMTPILNSFGAGLPAVSGAAAISTSALTNQEASLLGMISIMIGNGSYDLEPENPEFKERRKKIIEKFLLTKEAIYESEVSMSMVLQESIKKDNIDFAEEMLKIIEENMDLSSKDKYRLFISTIKKSKNKKLIPLIKKILKADEDSLSSIVKEEYLSLIEKNPEFAEELLDTDKINGEDKTIVLDRLKYLDKDFIKKIMNNENFTKYERAAILTEVSDTISKWERFPFISYPRKCKQLIEDILSDEKADPFFLSDIIETIKKSNIDVVREVMENDNIHSCDKFYVIPALNKSNIEYARENILNNPHINSCDMPDIIVKISDMREKLRKIIKDKVLCNDKLKSCDIADFINEIRRKSDINTEYMNFVLNNDNIPSKYKGMFYYHTNSKNLNWIKKISGYENKELVALLVFLEQHAIDTEKYHKKAIELMENKCGKDSLLNTIFSEKNLFEKYLQLLDNPNIFYSDLHRITHSTNSDIVNEFLNQNYMSIVKNFPKGTLENEILQQTKESDVIQIGKQLYINDGEKLFKWNMTKEAFDKLFPPFKRFITNQGNVGDCYLISVLIGLMNSPKGRKFLYKSFSQEGSDILCTIRAYKDYGGTKRFKNEELPETTTRMDACKGLQMLEQTYNEVALLESAEVNHPETEFLNNLDRICGGFELDALMDLTGAEKTNNIERNFKHKVARVNLNNVTKGFLGKYVNDKNNCCFVDFKDNIRRFGILGQHAYILASYDVEDNEVSLINPHNSLEIKKLDYDYFRFLVNSLVICNLEEK